MATSTLNPSSATFITLEELEDVIKEALRITELQKEIDLCGYLFYKGEQLSPTAYLELKDTDRQVLYKLIRKSILDIKLEERFSRRAKVPEKLSYTGQSLEQCIQEAMIKLNLQRETAMCKYIPYENGHLHHFTYLKMKSSNPIQLRNLIKMHIFDQRPQLLPPMKRKQYIFKNSQQPSEHQFFKSEEEEDLEKVIHQAIERRDLNLETEEDLGKYLPRGDSFLHPLEYRTLKRNNPKRLIRLIKDYVVLPENPKLLEWKKVDRYPSNFKPAEKTRLSNGGEAASSSDSGKIEQLLEAISSLIETLQKSKVEKVVSNRLECPSKKMIPERCFQMVQTELIAKILKKDVDLNLWEAYVELIEISKQTTF